jgi:hypothetical protein
MNSPFSSTSAARLERLPFVVAVVTVYLLGFASQMLLSGPVASRLGVVPFVAAQAVLIWFWVGLHVRRLRDAGRPTGTVFGVASVYALSVVLLVILLWLVLSAADSGGAGPNAGILQLFVVLALLGSMGRDSGLGALQIWVVGFAVLMLLPVAIALGFSIWAGMQPNGGGAR